MLPERMADGAIEGEECQKTSLTEPFRPSTACAESSATPVPVSPTCWSGWITTPSNERTIEGTVKVSDQELPRWVTIKQAAEYYQLDPKTIRRMIAQGKLKARRVGEKHPR